MRALTNQLLNVSHLLILPVSLVFIILGITIVHYQDSQTQPIQPHIVSNYTKDKSGVDFQQAYEIPVIADNYVGNNPQQLTSNSTSAVSNNSSRVAIKAQSATTPAQNASPTGKSSLFMNSMDLSSSLNTQEN